MPDEERLSRRTFVKLSGASAATAALAGCSGTGGSDDGGSGDGGGGDGGDGDESTPTETAAGDGSDDGGSAANDEEFVFVNNGRPVPYDPGTNQGWVGTVSMVNFYDPLVFVDPETKAPAAHLATDWSIEDDGRTWVFTLRDDVTFHSGNALTAEDVAYSLERTMALNLGKASLWSGFLTADSAEVRDERTVALTSERQFGPMLATLVNLFVADGQAVRANADTEYGEEYLKWNVEGSGPYGLREKRSEEILFEAHEDYWGGWDDAQFKRARYKGVLEPSTLKNLIKTGQADMAGSWLSPTDYEEMASADGVTLEQVPSWRLFHIPLNTQKKPTDDLNVRKAIVHAIDYESIMSGIFPGAERVAGPVPSNMPGHNDDLAPYQQDVASAESFLDQADYSLDEINETGIELVYVAQLEYEREIGLVIKQNLGDLGIEVELNPLPYPNITERNTEPETSPHMLQIFVGASYPSPDTFLKQLFHEDALGLSFTSSWFTTDELTGLIDDARTTVDADERMAKFREAQRIVYDAYPSVFLMQYPLFAPIQEGIEGFTFRGVDGYEVRWYDFRRT